MVVLGREQPSPQAIERATRPFTAEDDEPFLPVGAYAKQIRRRRTRDGGVSVEAVEVHPDPRCQALLEQVREAEIVQAVDRMRPVFNHRRIYLLTSVVVDATVDRLTTWRDLQPTRFARALARHGVLPLSKRELARCFPDLWGSCRAVENDLAKGRIKNGRIPQIETLFGESGIYRPAQRRAS